jgi:hypothetical protein
MLQLCCHLGQDDKVGVKNWSALQSFTDFSKRMDNDNLKAVVQLADGFSPRSWASQYTSKYCGTRECLPHQYSQTAA